MINLGMLISIVINMHIRLRSLERGDGVAKDASDRTHKVFKSFLLKTINKEKDYEYAIELQDAYDGLEKMDRLLEEDKDNE